jgi:predicted DNA-binding transcriptional regulator AlpA
MKPLHKAKQPSDLSLRKALAIREFCERYGICRETFYQEVRCGRLRARKIGEKTVVLKPDEDAWVASMPALELSATA